MITLGLDDHEGSETLAVPVDGPTPCASVAVAAGGCPDIDVTAVFTRASDDVELVETFWCVGARANAGDPVTVVTNPGAGRADVVRVAVDADGEDVDPDTLTPSVGMTLGGAMTTMEFAAGPLNTGEEWTLALSVKARRG